MPDFNSSMVRLKLVCRCTGAETCYPFQFLNGPIKTMGVTSKQVKIFKFQFLNGPIKTIPHLSRTIVVNYFNSSMVRLKRYRFLHLVISQKNFNSSMVRLKPEYLHLQALTLAFQFRYGPIKTTIFTMISQSN